MVALESQIENFVCFGDSASGAVGAGNFSARDAASAGQWLEMFAKKSAAHLSCICVFNSRWHLGNFLISRKCLCCCSFLQELRQVAALMDEISFSAARGLAMTSSLLMVQVEGFRPSLFVAVMVALIGHQSPRLSACLKG